MKRILIKIIIFNMVALLVSDACIIIFPLFLFVLGGEGGVSGHGIYSWYFKTFSNAQQRKQDKLWPQKISRQWILGHWEFNRTRQVKEWYFLVKHSGIQSQQFNENNLSVQY